MSYRVEIEFTHKGLKCVVVAIEDRGHRCGYVGVDNSHPYYGKDYTDVDNIYVHGGLTYSTSKENSNYPIESNLWWFGYDCAHWGDAKDLSMAINPAILEVERMYPETGIVRTLAFCMNECRDLAEQLSEVESNAKV